MPVILRIPGTNHVVTGANGDAATFSEDQSMALQFVDAAAATAFASGKNIHGAQQVTVTGKANRGTKTIS